MPITPAQAKNSLTGAVDETGLLTSGQQTFASVLATQTGLDVRVVAAWLLAEESGAAAKTRQSTSNNDWLNIGYTGSGTFGSSDAIWANPVSAASATAQWLKGQASVPGYGKASSGIQSILGSAKSDPSSQIAAIQKSGWASSGYPSLPSLYSQVSGSKSTAAGIANALTSPAVAAASGVSSVANTISGIPAAIEDVWKSAVSDAKYAVVTVAILIVGVMLISRAFSGGGSSEKVKVIPV
jgi:hypothetical protein